MEVHQHENNHESKKHLEENRPKFSKQCLKVLELLNQGKKLTTVNAPQYGILSLPRRILDLKQNNVHIDDQWLTDENGKRTIKQWFINFKTEAQKKEHVYRKGEKTAADCARDLIKFANERLGKTGQGELF